MKQSRFNRLINSQTLAAKRVYEAVPIQEDWDSMQVNRELYRLGTKLNFSIVEGCLNTLKEAKLIKEVSRGRFKRVPVESIPDEHDEHEPPQQEASMAQEPNIAKPLTPFDTLTKLGERVEKMAADLKNLVNDIEHVALSITEQAEKDNAELIALRQWKTNFKNLLSE